MALSTVMVLQHVANTLTGKCPSDVSFGSLLEDLEGLPGVRTVHDLHVWPLTSVDNALSVHLSIGKDSFPGCWLKSYGVLVCVMSVDDCFWLI